MGSQEETLRTTHPIIPTLPANAKLEYLGEGAANIVYRISIPTSPARGGTPPPTELEEYGEGTPPPSEIESHEGDKNVPDFTIFENKLLRVRKDLPTTLPCSDAQEQWSKYIFPLFFPSQLVHQSLVSLRTPEYNHITTLNSSLKEWETIISTKEHDNRPTKRQGVYLANDEYGLLVTDMSGPNVAEFKPKWLAQSVSAPEGAKRCRQCALQAQKAASFPAKGAILVNPKFCPLRFLSQDEAVINTAALVIQCPSGDRESKIDLKAHARLREWLTGTGRYLLNGLRDAQVRMAGRGVLAANTDDENDNLDLRVAMTLRDCTVFVRLPENAGNGKGKEGKLEARIGDLDVKSPAKLSYWQETERMLIDGGWYTATEAGEPGKNMCALDSLAQAGFF